MNGQKVAVVTGAGSGIGRDTALLLAQKGYMAVALDIHPFVSNHESMCFLLCDVKKERSVIGTIFQICKAFDRIDVLVNCVGEHLAKPIMDTWTSEFDSVTNVNMRSLFFMVREAMPYLKKSGGVIINVASGVAIAPDPTAPLYSASKAWVKTFTEALYLGYPRTGVRAHVVVPGPTDTPFLLEACGHSPAAVEECGSNIPLGRLIRPDEIARDILYVIEHGEHLGPMFDCSGGETVNFKTERR